MAPWFVPLRYVRAHAFSTMALCNVLGDLGYLGFAFHAGGFVSLPKLFGALFTMLAHVILLAYGDDQAQKIADEKGAIAHFILMLRQSAQYVTQYMPQKIRHILKRKPVGVSFAMLAVNGAGLSWDALSHFHNFLAVSMMIQGVMGVLIVFGTSAFAAADFVKTQKMANILIKIAPSILVLASVANIGLAITTGNAFIMLSVVAFLLSNLAGFYTRIDKKEPISAGI